MDLRTLSCPQCGGALLRQALWRTVTCTYCSADVTRCQDVVHAARFREAHLRSVAGHDGPGTIACGARHYRPIAQLGSGDSATVMLAERAGPFGERVVVKIARAGTPVAHLQREKAVLDQLQADQSPGSAYFSQRLPQAICLDAGSDAGLPQQTLVLRNPTGYWGSLADAKRHYPYGIDPRHAVWMWRRVLEVLAHVHGIGWAHGQLTPEHLLVHPRDHGILIISWGRARQDAHLQGRDLAQSAWAIRAMLCDAPGQPTFAPGTPAPLAALLDRASTDVAWSAAQGALRLNELLGQAARDAFGPARFVHFTPAPSPS